MISFAVFGLTSELPNVMSLRTELFEYNVILPQLLGVNVTRGSVHSALSTLTLKTEVNEMSGLY